MLKTNCATLTGKVKSKINQEKNENEGETNKNPGGSDDNSTPRTTLLL